MKHRLHPGDHMPEFSYDTPYEPQNSFYALLEEDERPLFMIFLRNFGHPFTRHYIVRYAQTIQSLYSARLVCVVRTRPETIGPHLPKGTMPYPVICDAEGALYDYFEIPRIRGRMRTLSWEGLRILKEAKKQGYQESKEVPQQMPLTLLIAPDGEVLLAHYGASVTDQPESCEAMETVYQEMRRAAGAGRGKAARGGGEEEAGRLLYEEAAKSAPRRREAPPAPEDEDGMVLGELALSGPELPPNQRKPSPPPAPARPAVPISLTKPLSLGPDRKETTPPAPPRPAASETLPGPGIYAPPKPSARPAAPDTDLPIIQRPAESPAAPAKAEEPAAPLPEEPAAQKEAPAPSLPEKKEPPVVPAITSPSGPAAEDLALQKFRSAAATLFSDEF